MAKFTSENEARELVAKTALEYLGVKEGSNAHKAIIDAYNSVKPIPRGYKVKYTDAWCATFVTFIFDKCNMANLIERECGCQEMIDKCKKRNLVDFKKLDSSWEVGNIVFYDWDNNGRNDHVGIIYRVTTTQAYVIEGNYNDEVCIRIIDLTDKFVSCIATPYFDTCVLKPEEKYYDIGWHENSSGWWYAYGINSEDYFKNTFEYIDGQLYAFDTEGYICDATNCVRNSDGAIQYIGGSRL